jgi:hypothetical protein
VPCQEVIRNTVGATKPVLYGNPRRKESVRREQPFREIFGAEAEESPLVNIQQAGKDLVCAVVICKV